MEGVINVISITLAWPFFVGSEIFSFVAGAYCQFAQIFATVGAQCAFNGVSAPIDKWVAVFVMPIAYLLTVILIVGGAVFIHDLFKRKVIVGRYFIYICVVIYLAMSAMFVAQDATDKYLPILDMAVVVISTIFIISVDYLLVRYLRKRDSNTK